jgi:crotonobetainyl-CoA:carnitine CoA-transferase CaiB-like acyl-CoA transferase
VTPLANIRVVDFTEGAQGPFAASLLADLGAEIVKIERPGGELMRRFGPYVDGRALPVLTISHGRAAVAELDMKDAAQRATADELIGAADVLLQNWKIGTDAKLGLDYATLAAPNPRLVYVRACGYGSRGPLAEMGSMDPLSQAVSGMASLSGDPAGSGERTRTPLLDFVSAFVTSQAAMIGVAERRRTGRGLLVDTSQLAAALDLIGPEVALANLGAVAPAGTESRYYPVGGLFATRDGVWTAIECEADEEARALAAALGLAEATNATVREAVLRLDAAALRRILADAGVPHAAVERPFTAELFDRLPGAVRRRHDETVGEIRMPETPWLYGRTPAAAGAPLGPVGRDTAALPALLRRWQQRGEVG